MARNIYVVENTDYSIDDRPIEIVERKGKGHPDSLCDGIAERISVEYTKWCIEHIGHPLHHNFDKVQLVAGDVDVRYGYAEMQKPLHIQIAGRGTPVAPDGTRVPVDTIAINAAKAHIRETMRYLDPDKHCVIDCFAGHGSNELMYAVGEITANDTSFGVAHWPRSVLESAVYETCEYITNVLIDKFPIGEDVKVMGSRFGNDMTLTCAIPLIGPRIADVKEYIEVKEAIRQDIQQYADALDSRNTTVFVNTADVEAEGAVYLTLTGTSAECGDDGSVGRGNRVTGVIAPFRSASLEAAAGKNPISHVGKLYNVLSLVIGQDVTKEVPEVAECQMYILSQIGKPLDKPLVATATVKAKSGKLSDDAKAKVTAIIDRNLADMDGLRAKLLKMEVPTY